MSIGVLEGYSFFISQIVVGAWQKCYMCVSSPLRLHWDQSRHVLYEKSQSWCDSPLQAIIKHSLLTSP